LKIINNHTQEDKDKTVRGLLKTNETISKMLGLIYCEQPMALSEVTERYSLLFRPIKRPYVYEILKSMIFNGLVISETPSDSIKSNSVIHNNIQKKHTKFLDSKVPPSFRNASHISNMNYYYVTKYGEQFLKEAQERGNYKMEE